QNLTEEKSFIEIHTILYWLNKDDPQGESTEKPESSPQFKNWEISLQNWLKLNYPAVFNQLPKDFDY
ncbi:MAG: hypothetical protein AAB789_01840, partial [Patescibacteria group bacterium]